MPFSPPLRAVRAVALVCAVAAAAPAAAAQPVLVVETTPRGATVWVDGLPVGEAPVRTRVAPGRHMVEARSRGYLTYRETVTVGDVDTLRVALALERESGRLRVEGLPPGATVLAEGEPVGDPLDAAVSVGRREIRVEVPGGRAATARVPFELARTTTVRYVPDAVTLAPVARNLLLPGAAQLADGRRGAGMAYRAGTGLALGAGLFGMVAASAAQSDFDAAVLAYQRARSGAEAVERWAAVEDRHAALQRGEVLRNAGLAAALALYTASAADAFLFHTRRPVLEVGEPGIAWEVAPTSEGLAVRLRF